MKQPVFESSLGGELSAKYLLTDAFRVGINLGYYRLNEHNFIVQNGKGNIKVVSNSIPVSVSVSGEFLFLNNKFRSYIGAHISLL